MTTHGTDSPWAPFFKALEPGTEVIVKFPTRQVGGVRGGYDGDATWGDRDETVEYKGIIVTNDEGVMTWVPYDVIVAVELL